MKTILHKADTRGHASHGWLDSYHTFSFANYHDQSRINFGVLRVLNDDVVQGGMGFGKHPHDNMEIISIPLSGELEHQDNTGHDEIIKTNDVQIMSAGKGIAHSEKNASSKSAVNFLQIWILPKLRSIEPRYEQKTFNPEQRIDKLQVVVSPDKTDDSILINQDAWFSLGNLNEGFHTDYKVKKNGNGVYFFVIKGDVTINDQKLNTRDGLGVYDTDNISITADSHLEILVMDIPLTV